MADKAKDHEELHYDNEYSRLIGTIGKEALKKLQSSRILLSGLGGLGVEIAKNIVLMGVASLALHDTVPVSLADLSSNFFLTESDVGKNRAEASMPKLVELNERVKISVETAELTENFLKGFTVVVLTNSLRSREELLKVSSFCHNNGIKFIAGDVAGLFAWFFNDFVQYTCVDANGENPSSTYVASISNDASGVVTVVEQSRHELMDGDTVRITEVEGMTELNGKEFKVKVTGPYTFEIGDTTNFGVYTKGGLVQQIKVPFVIPFKPLSDFFGKSVSAFEDVLLPDLSKFDRTAGYHFYMQALLKFNSAHKRHPSPGSAADAAEVVGYAAEYAKEADAQATLDDATKKWMTLLAKGAAGVVSPMAAALGGIIGQEIIKATSSKYMPVRQFLYYDALECLPREDLTEADCRPQGTRYDGQIAVFGKDFNDRVLNQRYFLIGAGAIGCEVLKCWAMMGLGCGPNGKVHVTDMDTIEISNLNRQFLYRPWDVSKFKSETSAAAAKKMNSNMNITAWSVKVGPDTEGTYDARFWEELTGCCNALDNMNARLYMDQRCIFYKKSLLESGTQGTKGNTQVIVPHVTESYGSSVDPPAKETPVCLLHSFPNNIEHCMQWSREILFEGHFVKDPEITNNFLDQDNYIDSLSPTQRFPTLETLGSTILGRPQTFDDCIAWARAEFDKRYNHAPQQLLFNFPRDYVDQHGTPFWSGAKRPPTPTTFDAANELHLGFVVAGAFLKAYTCRIIPSEHKPADYQQQVKHIAEVASKIPTPKFVALQNLKIETDESVTKGPAASFADADEEKANAILAKLPDRSMAEDKRMNVVDFEKDDDTNFHIDFIHAASNLRAAAYSIPTVNRLQSKLVAGKIIPAIVTTTAAAVGFVNMELYKLVAGNKKLEDFRNTFMNLALPMFQQSEPIKPATLKYLDKEFTLWDRIDVRIGDATLQEVIDYFEKEHGITIDMLGAGQSLLYASWAIAKAKERLPKKLTQVYEDVTQKPIDRTKTKYIMLEPTATDAEGNDIEHLPTIVYWF